MGSQPQDQLRTINPLLLDKSAETVQTHEWSFPAKSKFTFEAPVSRKHQPHAHAGGDTRKQQGSNVDILLRGREMGMKIWALEKLQRMMTTMFDTTLQQHAHGHAHPPRDTAADTARNTRANLFQMLQNERLNGPSDRDSTVATKELVPFKGPYIYIRDMDEKTRPIMVRQYQKVAHRDDGTWPQFRSASRWRCPFVEDTPLTKQEAEREEARERYNLARIEKQSRAAQRAQIAATAAGTKMQSSKQEGQNDPLNVCQGNGERTLKPGEAAAGEPFRVPRYVPSKRGSPEKAGKILSATYPRHRPYVVNEPIASGVQPSNITSAIRSQMISSTAAAPGLKAGTSREVHELKRKVLEKNSGPAANRVPHLSRMADLANGTRSAQMMRTTNGKGQEKLRYIDEEFTPSEEEENARLAANSKKSVDARQKKPQKKDAKPGYCENCQEKFDDFEKVSSNMTWMILPG